MKHALSRIITAIENTPITLGSFALAFVGLIIVRLTIENSLGFFAPHTFFYLFFEFTHALLFFLCAFLLLLPIVRFAGAVSFTASVNILLFGFLIILTPPIIDTIIFHGSHFWSFYEFDGLSGLGKRFLTLFGDTPDIGITYGVRIEVVIVTLALGLYAFVRSRRLGKALLTALFTYTVLFVLGTFPSWITLIVFSLQKGLLAISGNDVAALFLTPERIFSRAITDFRSVLNVKMSLLYGVLVTFLIGIHVFHTFPKYSKALWENLRFPQLIYHGGLLLLGMMLALFFSGTSLTINIFHGAGILLLFVAVGCSWVASVIANDCYDMRIDARTNKRRPLIENTLPSELYKAIGFLLFAASLLFSGIVSFAALMLLLGYQAVAWLYSAPPFRLKQYPLIATALTAFASILVLITGFLVIEQDIHSLPLALLVFFFIAYTLALPLKDFKDIQGDALDRIFTIPVLFGEKKAKVILGSLIFLLYIASPFVLHASSLFIPALFFGSMTFWTIHQGTDSYSSFFSYRKLPGIVLAITVLYGFVIVGMLF